MGEGQSVKTDPKAVKTVMEKAMPEESRREKNEARTLVTPQNKNTLNAIYNPSSFQGLLGPTFFQPFETFGIFLFPPPLRLFVFMKLAPQPPVTYVSFLFCFSFISL